MPSPYRTTVHKNMKKRLVRYRNGTVDRAKSTSSALIRDEVRKTSIDSQNIVKKLEDNNFQSVVYSLTVPKTS